MTTSGDCRKGYLNCPVRPTNADPQVLTAIAEHCG